MIQQPQHNDVRSDLWSTMTPAELTHQLDIIATRRHTLYMMGTKAGPAGPALIEALNHAEAAILEIMAR